MMLRTVLFLFYFGWCTVAIGQTFQDCISIDFERILDEPSVDRLVIDQQFRDTFGLSFSLETGGHPVLAQVGGAQTAFNSAYGPDTPAPNQNIGSFFLTDDGVLQGLNAPPIILEFTAPVDSFSGCILDMDFGEIFIIRANDINDELILEDTVVAGDEGTGDGLATCWGFNLEGCEGSVYSIRFEGQRTTSGSFGMGLDNLVFCQSGVDIANVLNFESSPARCDGTLGSITVIPNSDENFIYAINDQEFQSSTVFENLEPGIYTISVQNEDGCLADIDVLVQGEMFTSFTQLVSLDAICEESNGSIQVLVDDVLGIRYSLDDMNYQDEPVFDNLAPDFYTVYMIDAFGCRSQQSIFVENTDLTITNVVETHTLCNEPNGVLEIVPSADFGITYSIDGVNFQDDPIFTDLAPGMYSVLVSNGGSCVDSLIVTVLPSDDVRLVADAIPDWCNNSDGAIFLQASGGSGNYMYALDTTIVQNTSSFEGLSSNTYLVSAEDENGCLTEAEVRIDTGDPVVIMDLDSEEPNCENLTGSIFVNSEGGNGRLSYSLNGEIPTNSSTFFNLEAGEYNIIVSDVQGCIDSIQTSFGLPRCPIYIPNVFTPKGDGINDYFQVFTNNIYDVEIMNFSIYDRWGNQMWEDNNYTIHTADISNWWDGTFRGENVNSGVFVYKLEVRHLNGDAEFYKGDVTLLR